MNQQGSFHAIFGPNALTHSFNSKWARFAELEFASKTSSTATNRENSHNESTSQFSRNELDQMRSLAHSIGNRQGLLSANLLQRQVQLQQTERIHTMNQQGSFHAMN